MGSFHTNGRSISIQLTERFLDMSTYIPTKWPTEYVDEFLPVLECFKYQQGSLIQNTVETTASERKFICNPLSPIHECCWQPSDIQQLEKLCKEELNIPDCHVLIVTRWTKRLLLNNCYLSCDHRKGLIFAMREESGATLAQAIHFSECKCEVSGASESVGPTQKVWVIAVKWYMEHPYKVWYGSPSQVWSSIQRSDIALIPITSFISRAVYIEASIEASVNFGRIIRMYASDYCHTH